LATGRHHRIFGRFETARAKMTIELTVADHHNYRYLELLFYQIAIAVISSINIACLVSGFRGI
jgi:hypothetical protein